MVFRGDKEQYINYRLASEPSTGSLAKSYGISSIPVYGTILYGREAAKGGWTGSEIGWMSLSVGADIAMIVPPIGMAARAAIPARAGIMAGRLTTFSRIANVARTAFKTPKAFFTGFKFKTPIGGSARTIITGVGGKAGKKATTFFTPATGLKSGVRSFVKNIKYPFQHPVATAKSFRGLTTGSMVYPSVRMPLKSVRPLDMVKAEGRITGNVKVTDVMESMKYKGPASTIQSYGAKAVEKVYGPEIFGI